MARPDRGRRGEEATFVVELAQAQLSLEPVEVIRVQLAWRVCVEPQRQRVEQEQRPVDPQQELVQRQRLLKQRPQPHEREVALIVQRAEQQRQPVGLEP